jgi:hypothetical protein
LIQFLRSTAATETYITGGPWTLEQSGAGNDLKSSGYCDGNEYQLGNPGTERMQPLLFPVHHGLWEPFARVFDWRPKDIGWPSPSKSLIAQSRFHREER